MSDADCTPGREPRSVAASLNLNFSVGRYKSKRSVGQDVNLCSTSLVKFWEAPATSVRRSARLELKSVDVIVLLF